MLEGVSDTRRREGARLRVVERETSVQPILSTVVILAGLHLASLVAFTCFWKLDSASLSRTDEATHVLATQEMFQNGSMQPTVLGVPYYRKPPLKMWATLPLLKVFGEAKWVYRLPDALCGFSPDHERILRRSLSIWLCFFLE